MCCREGSISWFLCSANEINQCVERAIFFFLLFGGSALYFSINVNLMNHLTFKTPQICCNADFLIKFFKSDNANSLFISPQA